MSSFAAPGTTTPSATPGETGASDTPSVLWGPDGPSGTARLLALLFWIVLPALAVTGIVLGTMTWAQHADSAPPGIPGVYQVENRSCSGGICLQTGTFKSTDGNFVLPNVTGYSGWAAGTQHQVVYDPSVPDQIIPLTGRWDPSQTIAALVGAFAVLGVWGWFAFGTRRTPEPHPVPA